MDYTTLPALLNEKADWYNRPWFIESDPIQIPHRYTCKSDIEIAAFLTATIAWGSRPLIIRSASKMMELMGNQPFDFVMAAGQSQLQRLETFVHRTFSGIDLLFFVQSLRSIYKLHGGLEGVFTESFTASPSVAKALIAFRQMFFNQPHPERTRKHVSDVAKNAAAKRLNMFLRWMVRKDSRGVDFGLWQNIPMSALYLPLDLHTGNTARKLGILTRKQNDWKAVEEVTSVLQTFDSADPVRYDFALFGLGIYEQF